MRISCGELISETRKSSLYNFHTHTQFCDGKATMKEFVEEAVKRGFKALGFSPHSPIPFESPCNMTLEDVDNYFTQIDILRKENPGIKIFAGMEVDYLGEEWGAHNKYFASLPLDFTISSIHFIPAQDGTPVDIDGRFEQFRVKMEQFFHNDIRYVVDTYMQHTHQMLDSGGFEIIGHFDKIALNGSLFYPELESTQWFNQGIRDIIDHIASQGYIVEINTKAFEKHGRFFPNRRWWDVLKTRNIPLIVNSDAHYPELLDASRLLPLDLVG